MALVNDVAASALYPLVHSFLSDCGLSGTASALRKEIGKSSKKLAKDQVTLGVDKDLVEIVNVYRKSLAKEESTSEEEESESSSDDDDSNKEEESEEDNDEEEDNERLVKKSGKVSADSSSSSSSSREEVEAPVAVRKGSVKRKAGGKKRTVKEAIAAESSEEEEEKPVPKAKVNGKVKKADAAKKKIASKPDSSVGKVETKCSKKRKAVSTASSSEGDASGDGSEGGSEDDKPPPAKRLKIDARAAKVAPKRGKVDSSSSSSSSSSDISSSSEEESDSDSGEDSSSDESSDEEIEAQRAVAKASAEKERRKSAAAAAAAWVPKALTTPNGGGASEVANGGAKTPENKHGGKANGTGGNKGSGGRQGEAFKRVKDEHWVGSLKEGFDNNTYEATFGQGGYGFKASEKLSKVRGKDFRHEKTKKKRGSYRGGEISMNSYSVKFEDSD